FVLYFFIFQAEDGIRDRNVTGVQTCALPISFTCRRYLLGTCSRSFSHNIFKFKRLVVNSRFKLLTNFLIWIFQNKIKIVFVNICELVIIINKRKEDIWHIIFTSIFYSLETN